MDDLLPNMIIDEIRAVRDELRSFRETVTAWRQEMGERIATIETQIRPAILGNGQPSRLAVVESHVDELRRERWRLAGVATGVAGLFTILIELFRKKLGL